MYFTKAPGVGGRLRQRIEDFKVEEIPKPSPPGDEYTIFWLEKFNWDTNRALAAVAHALHVGPKRFGIAGTKDRRAVTKQRVSVWKVEPELLEHLRVRDIKVSGFEKSSERINLGDSEGNKFVITIRDIGLENDEVRMRLESLFFELDKGIPNIFGPQRFGEVRKVTSEVGRAMLRGDTEGAVKLYIAKAYDREPEDSKAARNFIWENWGDKENYLKALGMFPDRLHFERTMLDSLTKIPTDFAAALRRLPKRLRKMFLNAVQADVFNEVATWCATNYSLEQRTIPLVGHDTILSPSEPIDNKIMEIMKREGIEQSAFKMPHAPELATSGSSRNFMLVPKNLKIDDIADDDFNPGKLKAVISFELPAGAYASVVLAEVLKIGQE